MGGYQAFKKWLSYRERSVLGRALRPEEAQHFTDTARRIGYGGIMGSEVPLGENHAEERNSKAVSTILPRR